MNYMPSLNNRFILRSKSFSRAAAIFLTLVGALVLSGWLFDIFELKSAYGSITMKANAALALLLAGASLWILNLDDKNALARHVGRLCAAVVALVGALTLSQHLFGWNLGIDELLFVESAGALATTRPGRMGPPASTCFTLSGIALLMLHARRAILLTQALSIIIGLWALLAIIGYAYGAEKLYSVASYTGIAFHTAVSLLALSLGLLASRVDSGIISVISSDRAGGLMVRRLLIAAIGVPFLLGWLRLHAQWAGYYDLAFGDSLLISAIIVILTAIIWQSAAKLNYIEEQRLAAEAEVREQEERLTRTLESLTDGFQYIDADWRYGYVNPATKRTWLGQGVGNDVIGCHIFEAFPEARDTEFGHALVRAMTERVPVEVESFYPPFQRWYAARYFPTPEGGVSIFTQDITGRKESEAELRRANQLKDEFLATVSHELRTPLNAILGWASMLRRGKLDAAAAARALGIIERNAKAQAQLVEDLLDVSRIISGKLRLDVRPNDLTLVIKAAIDSVQHAADAKSIQLQMVLDPAASYIQGDAARLQQVVWNLLSNAIKFTPAGGLVQVRLDRTGSQAQITVTDTGEGINPEFLPHVFDRFQQADATKTRRHGGLGLGLAIVRHIVELHGGDVEAHSLGLGQGASFSVRLPLAAARTTGPLPALPSEGASRKEALTTTDSGVLYGLRVLAVDDEPDTRGMVKAVLEQYGADVMTVASARDAFEALPGYKPDVLVCDIGMPGEDGYSLIHRIRALRPEQGGDTPAIAITGYVRVEERARALDVGYQMFVPKPVEADELAAMIANLVGRTNKSISA
jgi:signal transduction histidine kinase/CheY-like chemotaxis protein